MGYNDLATGHQLHTIAVLCKSLGITDRLEDMRLTVGEAGILIRRLLNEKKTKIQDAKSTKQRNAYANKSRLDLW